MDEKEIQATMERLGETVARYVPGRTPMPAGTAQDMFKLGADLLVKFTRLVEAVECIADCQATMVLDSEENASLETARTEGSC